jgi:hypothetical protein
MIPVEALLMSANALADLAPTHGTFRRGLAMGSTKPD